MTVYTYLMIVFLCVSIEKSIIPMAMRFGSMKSTLENKHTIHEVSERMKIVTNYILNKKLYLIENAYYYRD